MRRLHCPNCGRGVAWKLFIVSQYTCPSCGTTSTWSSRHRRLALWVWAAIFMASVGAGEALTTARWAAYLVALGLALPATALFSYAFLGNLETRQYDRLHQPSEIAAKLREADTLVAQGMPSADVARAVGVSQATYARWRRQYGKLLSTTPSSSAQQAQGTERRS